MEVGMAPTSVVAPTSPAYTSSGDTTRQDSFSPMDSSRDRRRAVHGPEESASVQTETRRSVRLVRTARLENKAPTHSSRLSPVPAPFLLVSLPRVPLKPRSTAAVQSFLTPIHLGAARRALSQSSFGFSVRRCGARLQPLRRDYLVPLQLGSEAESLASYQTPRTRRGTRGLATPRTPRPFSLPSVFSRPSPTPRPRQLWCPRRWRDAEVYPLPRLGRVT